MAGGKLAAHVPCMVCITERRITKATRVYEGHETDRYRCESGHEFGMDWPAGPAIEALWPPSPEFQAMIEPQTGS